jgi:hypothetical protein
MPARIIDKSFEPHAGAIVVTIEDDLGARSLHTIHVLEPDGSEADVAGHIADLLMQAEDRAARLLAVFLKHGWNK